MAQRAMVTCFNSISGTSILNEMQISFHVCLLEESVPFPRETDLTIISPWTDSLAQIKTRISNAILAEAAANNYTSLTAANIIMPSFQKG